ncbi:stress response translation initiation inhibitor YciH [Orbaceae bacterium ESL0721]|nr:stress response translation initiation inhibitor YciH [Orbaceae bacterium ESL0721]
MNSSIVYSTDRGRIKSSPIKESQTARPAKSGLKGDGIVRIQRETSGRKGKGVSLIYGVNLDDTELHKLAGELKKRCGSGGSVKEGVIEIQGDNRDTLKLLLEERGFKVKLAGG